LSRPACLYKPSNPAGSRYCLWVHVENAAWNLFKVAVFTAATPYGPYTPSAPFTPVTGGNQDFTLYTDPADGTVYGFFSVSGGNIQVATISSDGQSVASFQSTGIPSTDSPEMFKAGSTYYLLTNPYAIATETNVTLYKTTTPLGTYTAAGFNMFDGAGPEPAASAYRSQPSWIFISQVTGQIIYMGTRWAYGNMGGSPVVIAPIDTSGANPKITYTSGVGFTPTGLITSTLSYPGAKSILNPAQLPTRDLYGYLD
jgi:hypothetical protein